MLTMKTLGIDLTDAGIEFAAADAAPNCMPRLSEPLGSAPRPMSATALSENGALLFGPAAEQRRFLHPRQACDGFIEDLSRQPSPLRHGGRVWSRAEIAYHFFKEQIAALADNAPDHDSVVLAAPAPLFEDNARSEEQVGLLLAIFGDLQVKLSSIVDSAIASVVDPQGHAPARGRCLVIDLGLQGAQLTLIRVGAELRRQAAVRLPGAGRLALAETARRALMDRFLRHTSFDVLARRDTEQAFHNQVQALLDSMTTRDESQLSVTSAGRERSMTVTRDMLAADLKPLVEVLVQGVVDLAARERINLTSLPIFLSSRAAQIVGLAQALQTRGAVSITLMQPGAAARGAAILATQRKCADDLACVPMESSVSYVAPAGDLRAAAARVFAIHRGSAHRHLVPTHVVVDGLAHAFVAPTLRVGLGGGQASSHIEITAVPAGIGPSELVFEPRNKHWFPRLELPGTEVLDLPGGDVPLAPGDAIEIGTDAGTITLHVIALQRE